MPIPHSACSITQTFSNTPYQRLILRSARHQHSYLRDIPLPTSRTNSLVIAYGHPYPSLCSRHSENLTPNHFLQTSYFLNENHLFIHNSPNTEHTNLYQHLPYFIIPAILQPPSTHHPYLKPHTNQPREPFLPHTLPQLTSPAPRKTRYGTITTAPDTTPTFAYPVGSRGHAV